MAQVPDPPTQRHATPRPARAGVDLSTLAITAVASAVAAYVTSQIWAPGTLWSAAMTPVFVALAKEGLARPVEKVATVAPALPRRRMPDDLAERLQEGTPPPVLPTAPGEEAGPVRVYNDRRRRLHWKVAVVTGLLGFAIAAAAYTLPELIAGSSVAGGGRGLTYFGGHSRHKRPSKGDTPATQTQTQTQTQTVTKTTTVPAPLTTTTPTKTAPAPTTTVPPATTTTPTPAVAPTTTPTQTTPPAVP